MTIIEEITEDNYKEKLEEGDKRVDEKLRVWKAQDPTYPNLYMLLDPTVWAYHILRDKEGKPLKLRGFQDKVINDKHRHISCVAANQIGKTWSMGVIKGIHHAIHVDNASVLIISRSEQQAVGILDEIKWMMNRANIDFKPIIDMVENRTELHIKNRDGKGVSVIRCMPATKRVLSFLSTLTICDEVGFWDIQGMQQDEYYYKVVETRSNETKNWTNEHFTMGQIVLISNPNGQRGILWDIWKNDDRFNKYRYCWLASSKNTIDEYNSAKNRLVSDFFDSSYAAVFSSAIGGFITGKEYDDAVKEPSDMAMPESDPLYIGGDFAGEDTRGRDVDDTIFFGAVRVQEEKLIKAKVVYLKEFPKRASKNKLVYPEIERLQSMYSIGGFGYDKVGVGDSVKNDLIDRGILPEYLIENFTYSLPNKSEIYYNMKGLFEQRRVILPDIPKLKEQLMGLRFERTDAGHIKVHHKKEEFHDDYADALANCLWMATRFGSGITVAFVEQTNRGKMKKEKKKPTARVAVLCKYCGMNAWSSQPEEKRCDDC